MGFFCVCVGLFKYVYVCFSICRSVSVYVGVWDGLFLWICRTISVYVGLFQCV